MELNENIVSEVEEIEKGLEGKNLFNDKKEIINRLGKLIVSAVEKRKASRVGIAFSGGVDSSLLALVCEKLGIKFFLYSVGLKGSKDLEKASVTALRNKWPIKIRILSLDELERVVRDVVKVTGDKDIVTVGVGSVNYSVFEMMKKDGVKIAFTGLGSEEIFAGYDRHKKAEDVNKESWVGLRGIWARDLVRDTKIADFFGVEVRCPYLDKELVRYAMQIDGKLKIHKGVEKYILRESAVSLGLSKEVAFRKKIAAQYGSGFVKGIDKIAKRNGFKYKKGWLESL